MIEPVVEIQENDDNENEDGFNCRLCMQSFWYQGALNDHLKSKHGIADPYKYEREERLKKLAILQKQKQLNSSRNSGVSILPRPSLPTRGLASSIAQNRGGEMFRRWNENNKTSSLSELRRNQQLSQGRISQGLVKGVTQLRTKGSAGFQYRDGAFVCENCKKKFNDGNVMVKHTCSKKDSYKNKHDYKKIKKDKTKRNRGKEKEKKRSRRGGSVSSIESDSDEIIEESNNDDDSDKEIVIKDEPSISLREKRKGHWTAYLLWSTRKRKEINKEYPDYSFADVGKAISDGWKKITPEETTLLKDEADELNRNNVKKLPETKEGSDEDDESENSEEEDPSIDETNLKKAFTKEIAPVRRSGRSRKNPTFFQEVAEKEDKLDEMLDHYEEKQIQESINESNEGKRKTKTTPKADASEAGPSSSSGPTRKYKKKVPSPLKDKRPVELETSRSGRVRKKARFNDYFTKDSEEEDSDNPEDDDFDVKGDREEQEEESSEEKSDSEGDNKDESDAEAKPLRSLRTPKDKKNKSKKKSTSKSSKGTRRSSRGKKGILKTPKRSNSKETEESDNNEDSDDAPDEETTDKQKDEKDKKSSNKDSGAVKATKDTNMKKSKHTSDVDDESDEEVETEQDREAQKFGLSDAKEANAALTLPLA